MWRVTNKSSLRSPNLRRKFCAIVAVESFNLNAVSGNSLSLINSNKDALIIRSNFFGKGPKHRASFSDFIINSLAENKIIELSKLVVEKLFGVLIPIQFIIIKIKDSIGKMTGSLVASIYTFYNFRVATNHNS